MSCRSYVGPVGCWPQRFGFGFAVFSARSGTRQ
jgi:hypothetical protein